MGKECDFLFFFRKWKKSYGGFRCLCCHLKTLETVPGGVCLCRGFDVVGEVGEEIEAGLGFNLADLAGVSGVLIDEENWAHYNDSGVPTFTNHTVTMTQLQGTRASSAVRTRTKEMFRRTQPQAHTARRMRK